jgi:pimeloyl-ACP methyl ester carboxylesterase
VSAPRPILIHGAGGDASLWIGQDGRFPGAAAVSLPGHSAGDAFDEADAAIDWLARILEAVPAPRVLVGHDLGGLLAIEVALARPDLVAGLVLTGVATRLPVADGALARIGSDFAGECRRVVESATADPAGAGGQALTTSLSEAGAQTLAADYALCREIDLDGRLGDLVPPTLVIGGADDAVTPFAASQELAEQIPQGGLILVENAGHLVMTDAAGTFNLLLAAFLARLELTLADE